MRTLRISVACLSMFALTFAVACGDDDSSGDREICNNLNDDDGDGLTDCADSDCISAANCQTTCDNDNICDMGETTANCPNDCPAVCDNDNVCDAGETTANCPNDCPAVTCDNDGTCDAGETTANCPNDCPGAGTCETVADLMAQDGCATNEKCTIVDAGGTLGCAADGSTAHYGDCAGGDTCLAGAGCVSFDSGATYFCAPFCAESADCPSGGLCQGQLSTAAGDALLCMPPDNCNLVDYSSGCASTEGCYLADVTTGSTTCAPAGSAGVGEACSSANGCQAGLGCAGNPGACVEWCTTATTCTAGTCQGIGDLPAPNADVGICTE